MNILLASTNKGKIVEMKAVLSDLPFTLMTLDDLQKKIPAPEETGTTFEENAIQKAKYYFERSKIPTIAEDSGIIVEALKDKLGIHTRRWGKGSAVSDEEWVAYFLEQMKSEKNKRAAFVCCAAFVDGNGIVETFEGRCDGVITESIEAPYLPGLPIAGCFKPDGHSSVYAGLKIEQKNSTSHRGKAMDALKKYLQKEKFV